MTNTSDGVFDAPSDTVTEPAGTAVIEFFDCRSGSFSYQLDEDEISGSFDLIRISDGAVCDELGRSPASATQ